MDFIDRIRDLASVAPKQLEYCLTEEATKTALVMPFINALGYNVFDPREVVPEFIADIGIKKGEKIDYAIFLNNTPMEKEQKYIGVFNDNRTEQRLPISGVDDIYNHSETIVARVKRYEEGRK